jgi:tetratricopeptide (TPR) repeat protein
MSPQSSESALAALNGVRPVLAHFDKPRSAEDLAADIIDLWAGAESALQTLVGNSALTGQQLVRAARQAELITLEQAHSLLEFLAARDRANRTSYKPTQADGEAAIEGFKALESALSGKPPGKRAAPSSPVQAAYTPRGTHTVQPSPPPSPPPSPYAPASAGAGRRQPPPYPTRKTVGPPSIEQPPPSFTPPGGSPHSSASMGRSNVEHALAAAEAGRRWPRQWPRVSMPILAGAILFLIILVGIFFAFRGGSSSEAMNAGIDAMKNGQRERARGEFAKAVKADPKASIPHVFLARLAREEGDLASARAQLDTALRLDPKNAIALREMGLILFASRQYDLARRFFVRAVQANPQDRASQGYLGCALLRLNRAQEGTKFINNAGNGPWTACVQPVTTATPPPL